MDPWFLVHSVPEHSNVIRTARQVNDQKPLWAVEEIRKEMSKVEAVIGRPVSVACLGLAFKPDIDDLRKSPAMMVYGRLIEEGCNVIAVEPNLLSHDEIELRSTSDALDLADLIVFLVAHTPFKTSSHQSLR